MSLGAINAPLAALFGLAYGMGHPSVAPYRPAMVDKTLASFHQDINRTAKEINASMSQLMLARAAINDASAGKPVVMRVAPSQAEPAIVEPPHARALLAQPERRNATLVAPARQKSGGFIELTAR